MQSAKAQEMDREALNRATTGSSVSNEAIVIAHFTGLGCADIRPRQNCLSYRAWRASGRQVRKGEKGCRVTTWVPIESNDRATGEKIRRVRPKAAYVFHISQTDPR